MFQNFKEELGFEATFHKRDFGNAISNTKLQLKSFHYLFHKLSKGCQLFDLLFLNALCKTVSVQPTPSLH